MSISEDTFLDVELIVHDPIHGSFSLPELAWSIIDTPEFQRLREINQTGNTRYVYPGAEHTRFPHCVAVAHLSLEFGRAIKLINPDLINDHQILLLCIAGLCHDLGHCAFSHLYDSVIIPMFDSGTGITCHEEASYKILYRIWEKYDHIHELLDIEDLHIIGKMILGAPDKVPESLRADLIWTDYDTRHSYLYEVVSNNRTGIDVDKFDYLKRDSHYTGIPCTFDPQRLMNFLSIQEDKRGRLVINYLRKSDELINSMWISRDDLHRRVYQHRVVKVIDLMTVEMIRLCADMCVPGTDIKLKSAHCDIDSYLCLTDSTIISMIETVPKAKQILIRIRERNLWATIATVISSKKLNFEFVETESDVTWSEASFRDEYVYYIYHKGRKQLDRAFYIELIKLAEGGEIRLRLKNHGTYQQEMQ